jgi:hypothetical protein
MKQMIEVYKPRNTKDCFSHPELGERHETDSSQSPRRQQLTS